MQFDPRELDSQYLYKLMSGLIVPRPIAWTSTLSPDGINNLAPFSFYMMITSTPPHIAISVGTRENRTKDTLRNIRHTGDFVVNTVNADVGQQMNLTSTVWPADVSEFEQAGLTAVPSEMVRACRVGESPASFECMARQIMPVGDERYGAELIIGEVVKLHIRDDLVLPNLRIDLKRLQAVGRLAGDWYCSTDDQYMMKRPDQDN